MIISLEPVDKVPLKASAVTFLTRVLANANLSGLELPSNIRGIIYIGDNPHQIAAGSWQIGDNIIYMARTSNQIDPLTRLAILTVLANFTGAIEEKAITEAIVGRIQGLITDSVKSIYSGFIRSTQKPSRLAVDQVNAQVAVQINGTWLLTNGAPAVVNESWTTMDF